MPLQNHPTDLQLQFLIPQSGPGNMLADSKAYLLLIRRVIRHPCLDEIRNAWACRITSLHLFSVFLGIVFWSKVGSTACYFQTGLILTLCDQDLLKYTASSDRAYPGLYRTYLVLDALAHAMNSTQRT